MKLRPHRSGQIIGRRSRRLGRRRRRHRRLDERPRSTARGREQIDGRPRPIAHIAVEQRLDGRRGNLSAAGGGRDDRGALRLGHGRESAARPREANLREPALKRLPLTREDWRRRKWRRATASPRRELASKLSLQLRRAGSLRVEVRTDRVADLALEILVRERAREHAAESRQLTGARTRGAQEPGAGQRRDGDPDRPALDLARSHTRLFVGVEELVLRRRGANLEAQVPDDLVAADSHAELTAGIGSNGTEANRRSVVASRERHDSHAAQPDTRLQHRHHNLDQFHRTPLHTSVG